MSNLVLESRSVLAVRLAIAQTRDYILACAKEYNNPLERLNDWKYGTTLTEEFEGSAEHHGAASMNSTFKTSLRSSLLQLNIDPDFLVSEELPEELNTLDAMLELAYNSAEETLKISAPEYARHMALEQ